MCNGAITSPYISLGMYALMLFIGGFLKTPYERIKKIKAYYNPFP